MPKTAAHRDAGASQRPLAQVPAYFTAALEKAPDAAARFAALAPSHKREYLTWIAEAKTAATRDRRVAEAVRRIADTRKTP